jgi:predicted amidophosphoribosyltransferase
MRPEELLRRHPPALWKAPEPLKRCKACEQMIARGARTCPHCGKTYTTAGGILIAIVIGLIIAAVLI